jgi:hypothetical protein
MKHGKRILLLSLLPGCLCLPVWTVHAQDHAFFRDIAGTVEVKAPGSSVWESAAPGDIIENNTLISTGFRSSAVVALGNSIIMIRPVTRLSLEEIIRRQNDEQTRLYLQAGRIRAEVHPPPEGRCDFTVRSPIATASVRGTSFEFNTENLRVDEGQVAYSLDNGRRTFVAAGEISYVDETGNNLVSPFEAAAELLAPALPPGSGSGNPLGDLAPRIMPPGDAAVKVGFGWD